MGKGTLFVPAAHGSRPYPILPTLEGSDGSAPRELGVGAVREPPLLSLIPIRGFHLRLFTLFPLRGTGQRSNPGSHRLAGRNEPASLPMGVAREIRYVLPPGGKLVRPYSRLWPPPCRDGNGEHCGEITHSSQVGERISQVLEALTPRDVKNEGRSGYVHENKWIVTKCTPLNSAFCTNLRPNVCTKTETSDK